MDPLAAFISKNIRTPAPAWPLAGETPGNSAALPRDPAVAPGTPADSLRHRSGTKRDHCGTMTGQMRLHCGMMRI